MHWNVRRRPLNKLEPIAFNEHVFMDAWIYVLRSFNEHI